MGSREDLRPRDFFLLLPMFLRHISADQCPPPGDSSFFPPMVLCHISEVEIPLPHLVAFFAFVLSLDRLYTQFGSTSVDLCLSVSISVSLLFYPSALPIRVSRLFAQRMARRSIPGPLHISMFFLFSAVVSANSSWRPCGKSVRPLTTSYVVC